MFSLVLSNLSATIDIVALALLLIIALYGLIQGFTKTFFSLFGSVIALFLAIALSTPVINYLQDKFYVVSTMSNNISGLVQDIFGKDLMRTKLSGATSSLLNGAGISGALVNIIISVKNKNVYPDDATVGDVVCPTIAYYIVLIIAVVALFVLIKLIFRIISKIVKKAYKSKSIARVDRFLGLALGLLYGIIVSELIILAISVLPFSFTQNIYIALQSSSIASFIEDINLLGLLTKKIIDTNIINVILKLL